jgi:cytochrome c peroxidase
MHDGSLKSLDDVITHYSNGGKRHSLQNKKIMEFSLTLREKEQLIDFLKSLTDTSYLKVLN